MRFNAKRVVLATVSCILLWIGFSVISVAFDVPSIRVVQAPLAGKPDYAERIQRLEDSVKSELNDSKNLLMYVKTRLESKRIQTELPVPKETASKPVLAVLVIACNRVTVHRCLDKLVRARPDADTFPIIVSQDCGHNETTRVIQGFASPDSGITMIQQPDQSDIPLPRSKLKFQGYYKIARHYKFALGHVFDTLAYQSVIIVEDDLDISDDFFEYFMGTYPLLQKDKSLWCISAWNDNGKKGLIDLSAPELLHRTDFFPGLGWMMLAETWHKLKPKWPLAFFDDWLREPEQTEGRSCIRPEISRTSTFGKEGVSKGLFFDLHLRFIRLNDQFVPFTKMDLGYLLKEAYDSRLAERVAAARPLKAAGALGGVGVGAVRLSYSNQAEFKYIAKKLGLMEDFRSGVPRTAYRGVVSCYDRGRRIYIVPSRSFTNYDPSWS